MTTDKKTETAPKGAASAPGSTRKAWTPKSTIDVVLEQIAKQEKKVAELQRELDGQETSLNKLLQAKKILEAS